MGTSLRQPHQDRLTFGVYPMQVLDQENDGLVAAKEEQEPNRCLLHAPGAFLAGNGRPARIPDGQFHDCHDRIEEPLIEALRASRGQHLFDCNRRRFGVAHAEQCLQHFPDHDEATAQVRFQRADFQVLGFVMRDGANEFMRDARLAKAGIADHENRLTFAVGRVVPGLVQNLQLHLAADEGRQLRFGAQLPARAAPPDLGHFKEPLVLRVFR